MVTSAHDIGEQFEARHLINDADVPLPASVDVLLFHDGEVSGNTTDGDDLTPTSDVGDITTEPGGSNYARQTVDLNTTDFAATQDGNGDWQLEIVATVEFQLDDSDGTATETFDSYAVVVAVFLRVLGAWRALIDALERKGW